MKTFQSIVVIIVVLLLAFFAFELWRKGTLTPNTLPPTEQASSIVGCYVATLGKDVYTLKMDAEDSDGNVTGMLAYNNFQKDSSSGSFVGNFDGSVLLGGYAFDSEGMHSERQVIFKKVGDDFMQGFGEVKVVGNVESFVDISKVTYDSNSTFKANRDCVGHFTGASDTVTLEYNSFFKANEGSTSPTIDWRANAKANGVVLASVLVPRGYMSGTNFSNAKLVVGRSADANEIKNCATSTNGEKNVGITTVSGFPFTKFTRSDAGAGNFYQVTSYRGIVDGDCYAVEYTIHSTNINNYSPDQGIQEFDKSKVVNELEKIVRSVKFLINSN